MAAFTASYPTSLRLCRIQQEGVDLTARSGFATLSCRQQVSPGAAQVNKTVRNEKRKLSANWCNTLATAVLTAGVFAPLAAIFYELTNSTADRHFLLGTAGICAAGGFALHFFGRFLLERLEEP
jgi:uncharacterized membrane protein